MREPFTISAIQKSACAGRNPHLINTQKKKNKFGNTRVVFDGRTFHSQKELNYYVKLRILEKAGEISNLRLQVPYELNPGGTHSLKYLADFVYEQNGKEIMVDVKGYRTKLYRKKKGLMLKVHGIEIIEV